MRIRQAFTFGSASALLLAACAFQACGGSEETNKKDGGDDGNIDTDTGTGMDGTVADTGDIDTGADTGPADNCRLLASCCQLMVSG